jgi:hypothetical protein
MRIDVFIIQTVVVTVLTMRKDQIFKVESSVQQFEL